MIHCEMKLREREDMGISVDEIRLIPSSTAGSAQVGVPFVIFPVALTLSVRDVLKLHDMGIIIHTGAELSDAEQ